MRQTFATTEKERANDDTDVLERVNKFNRVCFSKGVYQT